MRIVSWNLNFWQNWKNIKKRPEWKKSVLNYLNTLDCDFFLLQEINPTCLYDLDPDESKSRNKLVKESGKSAWIEFQLSDKAIFYNELDLEEIGAESAKEIVPWGNAIIARGIANKPRLNPLPDGDNYCGRRLLECIDFSLKNGKTVSFINFYGKNGSHSYPILEYGINDIEHTVKNNADKHLIILAGDFNSDPIKEPEYKKLFFGKLEELGFVNCTQGLAFKNTMVSGARSWPNDKVFVNKPYQDLVECSPQNDTNLELSDHKPIECIITGY
ncbi:hypothetical protein AGMMS50293_20510 [Spirochaetia bacterium]|nr:hypothetical protein AGMMS50293_20510 [Spirochaetia bacterium]